MTRKIEKLTPEQQELLPRWREEWLNVGLCTEPADRPRAEAAIAKMYAAIGKKPPLYLWAPSPLSAHFYLHFFKELPKLRGQLRGQLCDQLRGQLRGQLCDQLCDQLRGQLRDQLSDQLRGQLSGQLCDQLSGQLCDQLCDQLSGQLRGQLRDQRVAFDSNYFWGQHEAFWLAFYTFPEQIGVKYDPAHRERLGWWIEVDRSCNWWWPYEGICVLSDRPEICSMVDGRLHSTTGPAVRFRDGWSTWRIGGVQVDEQIVMTPETQRIAQIRSESNAEVKRIRIERFGWDRYLRETDAVILDKRRNDVEATRECLMRGPDGETVLVCACPSTARIYALVVEPGIITCEDAQNWLSGGHAGRTINAA
jgi:hypothetical protein